MTYSDALPDTPLASSLHGFFQSFPIACFTLTLLTDLTYVQTTNLLWLHFSEWLLLAGVIFGCIALLIRAIRFMVRKVRPAWLAILGGVVVLLLAIINSFIHTADGWTAVVPYGLTLSIVTVLAMFITNLLARKEVYHA